MAEGLEPGSVEPGRGRRLPDPVALFVGLVSLATACLAILGYTPGLPNFDPRWLLAGGAVLVGILLLVGSTRRARRDG